MRVTGEGVGQSGPSGMAYQLNPVPIYQVPN